MRDYEDLLLDVLFDQGFTLEEAIKLIQLDRRIASEREKEEHQKQFSRWLVIHGKLTEY